VAYRTQHGPLASFDDLAAVPGIGYGVISQLSGQISFDMATVAPPGALGRPAVASK